MPLSQWIIQLSRFIVGKIGPIMTAISRRLASQPYMFLPLSVFTPKKTPLHIKV